MRPVSLTFTIMEEIVINSPFSYHYNVLLAHAMFILCTRPPEYRICVSWRLLRGRGCGWILRRSVPRLKVNHVHVFMNT